MSIKDIASALSTELGQTVYYGIIPDEADGTLDEIVALRDFPLSRPEHAFGEDLPVRTEYGIAIHALGLVGTPYRYGGNTPDSGFDCSGLIGYVYRNQVGSAPPRTVAQLSSWGQVIDRSERRTGDLVVFGRGRNPSHAGIYVGEGRFVHAPSTGGEVRMDHLESKYWAKQNASFRRP